MDERINNMDERVSNMDERESATCILKQATWMRESQFHRRKGSMDEGVRIKD